MYLLTHHWGGVAHPQICFASPGKVIFEELRQTHPVRDWEVVCLLDVVIQSQRALEDALALLGPVSGLVMVMDDLIVAWIRFLTVMGMEPTRLLSNVHLTRPG